MGADIGIVAGQRGSIYDLRVFDSAPVGECVLIMN